VFLAKAQEEKIHFVPFNEKAQFFLPRAHIKENSTDK
jgi:hypothetical protein